MALKRISLVAVLLVLAGGSLFAQDEKPDLAKLWETGSLWEVGDNRAVVKDARQQIIDSGEEGLKFALTKLDAADTLHIRCLRGVFNGFEDNPDLKGKAFDGLVANIANEDATARRNVAELLASMDDERAAEHLVRQRSRDARRDGEVDGRQAVEAPEQLFSRPERTFNRGLVPPDIAHIPTCTIARAR